MVISVILLLLLSICNWNKQLNEKCSSKSHLTVKSIFLIMIFACHCNIHDNEIPIRITFRIGNWTPQSQEKYFRENLIHTLVFEFILRTLKGIMDDSNSCYNTTQVAYCTVINQYIYHQNEISKHLKVIHMLQAFLSLPWVIKAEILFTVSMEYQADSWQE